MTSIVSNFPGIEIEFIVTCDSDGNPLEGGKNYKMHLPHNIPARNFWSVIVYEKQTRLIIRTDQKWPSVFSNCQSLVVNHNGSVDVWFGPEISEENNCNWIQTIPGENLVYDFATL